MASLSSCCPAAPFALLLGTLASAVHAQIPPPVGTDEFARRQTTHWAWHPLRTEAPPTSSPHAVDAFLDARLHKAGLQRAPAAEPTTQLRRLWFDVVGLPPPPDAVQRFGADPSDAAWQREVDTLLASPHYGERWARHWLDLVRYAETMGHEYDFEVPNAWRYRDYVIRAIGGDVPYDQFVREHIAGDLLPSPRRDADGNNESVQATAAFWFVEQTHSPIDAAQHQADRIDNQVDVLGKAMLGLTISCARCHDHKFDAIRANDYYALVGFVQSSRYVQAPLQPVDVHGAAYQAILTAQRDLATAWAANAAGTTWPKLATTAPEQWQDEATPPLREGERRLLDSEGSLAEWFVTNDGFAAAPWRGPFCPDASAKTPQLFVLPGAFWHSGTAGARREGTLGSPTFLLAHRYVHVRTAGVGSRIKLVVDGFHLVRDPIYGALHRAVDDPNAHWVTFDTAPWAGRSAFLQCIDQVAPDLADPDHDRSHYPEHGWLAVQTVVLSPHGEAPPSTAGNPLAAAGWSELPANVQQALATLRTAAASLPVSPTIPSLTDGTGRDSHVALRGDHRKPGAIAPRRFLSALVGNEAMPTGPGSGRLALADAVLHPNNPLLARVFVNRVWHHLFGRGLVRSVDNLGALGDQPTHPELLDWLARDAIHHGWSQKHVLRRLLTSATYRQDSRVRPEAAVADGANVLLHRQNVRRLAAEAVRDSLLAVSGRLDAKQFGPSVELPKDAHIEARGRPARSGPLDGDGRRSIYLAVRRNFMPPMLLAFDLPTPFATVGARNVSNVPAQALTLANDPFVHAECARWATQLLATSAADVDARITLAYTGAFARLPSHDELTNCRAFLADTEGSWPDLLHALVNTTEFSYLR